MAVGIKTHLSKLEVPIGLINLPSIRGPIPDDNSTGVNWYGNDEVGFTSGGSNYLTLKNVGSLFAGTDIIGTIDHNFVRLDRIVPVTTVGKYTSIDLTSNVGANQMLSLRSVLESSTNYAFHLKTAAANVLNTLPAISALSDNKIGFNIDLPQFPFHASREGIRVTTPFEDTSFVTFSSESDLNSPGLTVISYSNQNTTRAVFKGVKAKGTTLLPTAVTDTNYTLSLLGAGYDGTSNIITAAIDFQVSGTPSTGVMPQAIIFRNGPTNSLLERMRITPAGKVGIGTPVPGPTLGVFGGVGIGSSYSTSTVSSGVLAVQTSIGIGLTTPSYPVHSYWTSANITHFFAETTSTGSGGAWSGWKDGLIATPHRIGVSQGVFTFQVEGISRADLKSDGFRYKADYSATWDNRSLVDKEYVDGLVGGGGNTDLTFSGSSSPVTLESSTGTDVVFTAGSNITFSQTGNNLTISSTSGGNTDLTFAGTSSPVTLESSTGSDVIFTAGSGIGFSQTGNNLTITNTASGSGITGVQDQANMLDIAAPGGIIEIAPNIPEGTLSNTYDAADSMMFYDQSAAAHRKMTLGTYLGSGFVDLINNQVNIAGDKGFTTSLHYGAATLPTSSHLGTTVGTNVYFAPTTTSITETNFNNSQGFIIHNHVNTGTQYQTTKLIAAGTDGGSGHASEIQFLVRPSGAGQNWTTTARVVNNAILIGQGNTGLAGGQMQVYALNGASIGFEGGFNNFQMGTTINTTTTFYVAEGGSVRDYLNSGVNGWIVASDVRLKKDINTLSVLDNIDKVRGVTYKLIDGAPYPVIGVIAQEIQEAYPEAVSVREDTEEKYLGVSYNAIASIALQGVKELKEYIDKLEARIEVLEKQLNK